LQNKKAQVGSGLTYSVALIVVVLVLAGFMAFVLFQAGQKVFSRNMAFVLFQAGQKVFSRNSIDLQEYNSESLETQKLLIAFLEHRINGVKVKEIFIKDKLEILDKDDFKEEFEKFFEYSGEDDYIFCIDGRNYLGESYTCDKAKTFDLVYERAEVFAYAGKEKLNLVLYRDE
jgi:hypothetical protein